MSLRSYSNTDAIFYGELVEIAYQMYFSDTSNPNPPQPSNFPSGWQIIFNITVDAVVPLFSEVQFIGFIAQSTTNSDSAIIAFRGTEGDLDWIKDLEFKPVPFTQVPNGGNVEYGFLSVYETLHGVIPSTGERRKLGDLVGELSAGSSLVVAGHSLGGALAILHGAVVAAGGGVNLSVYTYAAPMVGDQQFVTTFGSLVPESVRIYNFPDIIPDLPPSFLGYRQVQTGVMIDSLAYWNIKWSLSCFHSILTYLYVLGSSKFGLGSCAADSSAATSSLNVDTATPPD